MKAKAVDEMMERIKKGITLRPNKKKQVKKKEATTNKQIFDCNFKHLDDVTIKRSDLKQN